MRLMLLRTLLRPGMMQFGLVILLVIMAPSLVAKEAAPMAADPEMEKIVNDISAELRCLVCQNQTIADSHAELAVDLKNQVREMVKTGKQEKEIVDYMVQRYGDFVRYRPPVKNTTILLWTGPFILLTIGLIVLVVNLRKRATLVADDSPLTTEESEKLNNLLHENQRVEMQGKKSESGEGDSKS